MHRPQTAGKAGRSQANAVRDERGRGGRRREQALLTPSADRLLADARFLGFKGGAVNLWPKTPSSVPVA
jgi:hypothetical protein